jgi:hypothetical protein
MIPVTFRVKSKIIRKWNPYSGEITPVVCFSEAKDGIKVPLNLSPYESLFLEFSPGEPDAYVTKTSFYQVTEVGKNEIKTIADQNGTYYTALKSGNVEKQITSVISGIPAPLQISGKWKMDLEGEGFPLFTSESDYLTSWIEDPLIRNFSGTGRYQISFYLASEYLHKDLKLFLDLGKVGNIAEVILNDQKVGIRWMRGQKLEVTDVVKGGENRLTILVTNTLINRISAMKEAPAVPAELISQFGNRNVTNEKPREFGFKPLPASGLLGPVQLIPVKELNVRY